MTNMRRVDGFTLVETLVALAISAVAIVALLQIFAESTNTTFQNKARSIAELHLSSLIAQTDVLVSESTKEISGELPGNYRWRIRSVIPADISKTLPAEIVVRQITYVMSWEEGRHSREMSITSQRILNR